MIPLSEETNIMFGSFHTLNKYVVNQIVKNAQDNCPFGKIKENIIKIDLACILDISIYQIYPFGSRASGLSWPSSDCDLFIDTGDNYSKHQSKEEQADLAKKAFEILNKYPHIFSKLDCRFGARVPIVSFTHAQTDMNCDISFKNGLSVENTHLIKRYLNMDQRVRWVITAVKCWAKQNNFVGPGMFSSYALVWMTLYVLMLVRVVVPVVQLWEDYQGPEKYIAGWKCGFCRDKTPINLKPNNIRAHEILQLFFYYFANSDDYLKNVVLCPLFGEKIRKKTFKEFTLSLEYGSHVQKFRTRYGKVDRFNLNCMLCVQDPIELSKNITVNIYESTLKMFQLTCMASANQLDIILGESRNWWRVCAGKPKFS